MAAVPRPSLLIMPVDGSSRSQRYPVLKDALTIGRDAENDLRLASPTVSRHHLRLMRDGARWHVARAISSAAVFLNGEPIEQADLRTGDQLVLGAMVLRFELPDAPEQDQTAGGPAGHAATILAPQAAPTLLVRCGIAEFVVPLRAEQITLGRAPDSGIVVPSPVVSVNHAVLRRTPDHQYTIEDVGSSNGLKFHGVAIQGHRLRDGDTVMIGAPSSGERVTLTYMSASLRARTIVTAPLASGAAITIGRDPASTYPLASLLVSWRHARLQRDRSGGVLIEDVGSTNGTFVNERLLAHPQRLNPGDRLQIGPYGFIFDGALLTPVQRERGMRVDALDLVRTTPDGRVTLLDHASLIVTPGSFVAIAGGSGAGKTTLMRAMAGIQPAQRGLVLLDGVDSYAHRELFRGRIGYVPQVNIVHAHLPVERALYFAARLRLARDVSDKEIAARIEDVLDTLALSELRAKPIASLSGGEQRRVNIAVELLSEPPVIFLDEPNAGLDPHLRHALLDILRALARKGQTVVMVTHEPDDIMACDRLALLGKGGRLCYFGPPTGVLGYFGVGTIEEAYALLSEQGQADQWRTRFQSSPLYANATGRLAPSSSSTLQAAQRSRAAASRVRGLSGIAQTALLTRRYLELLARDRVNLAILLLQAPVIAVLLALVSKSGVFTSADGPVEAQKVLFLVAIAAIWFGTSNAAREISKEGDIYQRERLAGLGVLPYIFSKVIVLAALCVIQTLVLLLIITSKTGVPPYDAGLVAPPMIELLIGTLLAGLAGLAMGLCVSAFASTQDKAMSAAPIVLLPQILLAGVIFSVAGPAQIPADLTISRWSVQAMGTSADLDHLYYAQLVALNPALKDHPELVTRQANESASGFAPSDYDASPSITNYSLSVGADATWADARASRRAQLLLTWAMTGLLIVVFLGVASLRQRAKDPR